MKTPADRVRTQIEAAKDYLVAGGLRDVHDHPVLQSATFDQNVHTLLATSDLGRRILRLDLGWLEEHDPTPVRSWLEAKQIAESLNVDPDIDEITILSGGTLNFRRRSTT